MTETNIGEKGVLAKVKRIITRLTLIQRRIGPYVQDFDIFKFPKYTNLFSA